MQNGMSISNQQSTGSSAYSNGGGGGAGAGPYENVTGVGANGNPTLTQRPAPAGSYGSSSGSTGAGGKYYSEATYGGFASLHGAVSGGYGPSTSSHSQAVGLHTNAYAPVTERRRSSSVTSPRYGPGSVTSPVYDLTADLRPTGGGGGGGDARGVPYSGSVYGTAIPPSRDNSMHTYSELAQPAHLQQQYEYTAPQGQPQGAYTAPASRSGSASASASTAAAAGRRRDQYASASSATSDFNYLTPPSTLPRASAAPPPATGGSQSKYLDQVAQLILDGEECKKRGDLKTVTLRYQQAANVLMDMVEEQRWPPGEERRKAIATARRYIEHSKSYEMVGPGFATSN